MHRIVALLLLSCTPSRDTPTTVPVTTVPSGAPIASSAPGPAEPTTDCDRLPKGWSTDDMLREALNDPKASARVLVWQIDRDERPLVVERALLWLDRHGSWTLAHLYRHPLDARAQWHLSMVYDAPHKGADSYSSAPTRNDFDTFLQETWWEFEASSGFQLIGAEVCARAWKRSFGAPPWHAYQETTRKEPRTMP